MVRVYNILKSLFGESKQGYFDSHCTQYQFDCPTCKSENGNIPDNKYNLEVSFALGKYHCWKCGESGNISKLIREWGGKSLCDEYCAIIKDLRESRFFDRDMFKGDNGSGFSDNFLHLPETFTKIDLRTCRKKKLVDYLKSRGITQDMIDFYNIGYTQWEEPEWTMKNRIIFPSYDINGSLNYFIGRTFSDKDKRPKYRNCNADKLMIINHEDKIQWDADIVLVEGCIDSIYYPNSIALLGKTLVKNSELYRQLRRKSNGRIIICLDADTDITETKRIYNLLNTGKLRNKIWYIRLGDDYKDFGEVYEAEGRKGIIKVLNTAKQFSEIELLI